MAKNGAELWRQAIVGPGLISLSDLLTPQRVLQIRIQEHEPQFLQTLATKLLHHILHEQVSVQTQLLLLIERLETDLEAT